MGLSQSILSSVCPSVSLSMGPFLVLPSDGCIIVCLSDLFPVNEAYPTVQNINDPSAPPEQNILSWTGCQASDDASRLCPWNTVLYWLLSLKSYMTSVCYVKKTKKQLRSKQTYSEKTRKLIVLPWKFAFPLSGYERQIFWPNDHEKQLPTNFRSDSTSYPLRCWWNKRKSELCSARNRRCGGTKIGA